VAATVAILAAALPVYAGGNDFSITKSDSPDPVVSGATLTYTLTVTYDFGFASDTATVTDTLPAGVTFVSATSSVGTCSQAALVVTCTIPMAVGSSATVTIVVLAGAAGTISNTATVSGALGGESTPANNTDTEVTTVLAATPSPSPSPTPTPTLAPTLSPSPTATPVAAVLPDTAHFGTGETASGAAIAAALAVASLVALLFGLTRRRARSG